MTMAREARGEADPGDPQIKRDPEKGPAMGHHVHALCGEAEGPEHSRFGEQETTGQFNNCLQLVEGQLLEQQHQTPPSSARQHS